MRTAGLEGLGITQHTLRHMAASPAVADVEGRADDARAQDAAMTLNVYGHLFPDRLDEVADRLDAGRSVALDKIRAPVTGKA